ncbi:hypothetical protein TNCV_3942601 [Trichonephila clavipes]|nr:hypothetical protein TNCV_3942601 [Trichonephila clavipes]
MPPKRSVIGPSTNQAKRRRERASETNERRKTRQERDRDHTTLARSLETNEQRQARQERDRIHTALARSFETSEQRHKIIVMDDRPQRSVFTWSKVRSSLAKVRYAAVGSVDSHYEVFSANLK